MISVPERITSAWLNSLSLEQRIEFARHPFWRNMHRWVASHVTYIRWSPASFPAKVSGASIFFLNLDGKLLAVTAAHVYHGYLEAKKRSSDLVCQIGNLKFEPERRLKALETGVDIAAFKFEYHELAQVQKQALAASVDSWPPPHPFPGQAAYIVGFPAISRLWIDSHSMSFGLYVGSLRINCAFDRQITCPFERGFWVDTEGNGLPPPGMDLGGMSGGPLLLPMDRNGDWLLQLGGVISEARSTRDYETVVAVPAHFIAPDGTINSRSAPVYHAIRAQ